MARRGQKNKLENEGDKVFDEMVNGGGSEDAGKDAGAKQGEPTLIIESKSSDTSRPDPVEGAKKKNPDATKTKHQPDAPDATLAEGSQEDDKLKGELEKYPRVQELLDSQVAFMFRGGGRLPQGAWRVDQNLGLRFDQNGNLKVRIVPSLGEGKPRWPKATSIVRNANEIEVPTSVKSDRSKKDSGDTEKKPAVEEKKTEEEFRAAFAKVSLGKWMLNRKEDSQGNREIFFIDINRYDPKTGKVPVQIGNARLRIDGEEQKNEVVDVKTDMMDEDDLRDFLSESGRLYYVDPSLKGIHYALYENTNAKDDGNQKGKSKDKGRDNPALLPTQPGKQNKKAKKDMPPLRNDEVSTGLNDYEWNRYKDRLKFQKNEKRENALREELEAYKHEMDELNNEVSRGVSSARRDEIEARVSDLEKLVTHHEVELSQGVKASRPSGVDQAQSLPAPVELPRIELESARRHVEVEMSNPKENHKIQELQERLSVLAERRAQLERDLEEGRKQRLGFMEKLMSIVLKKKGQTVDLKNFDQEMKLKEERLAEVKKEEAEIRRQLDLEENEPFIGDGNILGKPDQGSATVEDAQVENGERGLLGLEMLSQELDSAAQEMDALIKARNKKERERKLRSVLMGIGIVLGSMTAERLAMEEIVERPIPIGHEDVIVNAATHGGNVDVSHAASSGGSAEASDAASAHTPDAPTAPAEGSVPTAPDSTVPGTGAADAASATAQPDAASEAVQSYGVEALSGQDLTVVQGNSVEGSIIEYLTSSQGMSEPQAGAEAHRLWENFLARNPNDFYLNSDHYITYPDARISFGSNGEIMSVVDSKRAVIGTLMRDVSGGSRSVWESIKSTAYENLSGAAKNRVDDILRQAGDMGLRVLAEGKDALHIIAEVSQRYASEKGFGQ